MIKVLIADDHPVVLEGFKRVLEGQNDIEVVGTLSEGRQILPFLRERPVDILMLDLSMDGGHFLSTIERVVKSHPRTRILVVTMHAEEAYAARCLRAGAAGFLRKDAAIDELVVALRDIHRGKKYASPEYMQLLLDEMERPGNAVRTHKSLSNREFEVFSMLVAGKRPSEIARELSLSPKTVSTHRNKVLKKLGLDTNAALVRYALANNLIGEDKVNQDSNE